MVTKERRRRHGPVPMIGIDDDNRRLAGVARRYGDV